MTENNEYVCEQDKREEDLKRQGYVSQKAYFHIGRTIYVIEPIDNETDAKEDALKTPIGEILQLQGTTDKIDDESAKLLQELFLSSGRLRIVVEGDPDCGFAGNSEIILSGYRAGLDDLILDKQLLKTTHGSQSEIIRGMADELDFYAYSQTTVPRWETYDGIGYQTKQDKQKESQIKRCAKKMRELADWIDHKDDPSKDLLKKAELK